MKKNLLFSLVLLLIVQVAHSQVSQPQTQGTRPNIVIILADDMGYSDMGAFGSEIKTPNMDALAMNGTRFTNYYTHASCSPTRSMILSGLDTHLNGLGAMDEWTAPNQMGKEGYEGHLSTNLVTLPRLLKDAGYHTYMVGKWHLGLGEGGLDWNGEIKPGPLEIGFDHSFIMAATGDRVPCVFVENHRVVGLA